jgi:serine/threonine-protein kinase
MDRGRDASDRPVSSTGGDATQGASAADHESARRETATGAAGGFVRGREPPVRDWDRYEILEYLGGGGMGRVFKAFDPKLGRQVAIKFIRGDDPELIRRFTQEARAQARVDHDRVCKVYEVGEVEGHPYIAMQLIDGIPFRDAARDMTLEHKLLVMKEVAEGLHEAHRSGLIHRDIKPSNIMVEMSEDGRWRPYVMDFGLAREQASPGMTVTGAVIGTPTYMPLEQALGWVHDMDRRSDVYQLGATLYSTLSGRPPFQGDTQTTVLRQVLEDAPESLTGTDRAIPADVDAIVMKCLRKSPRERYASARALAEDLGRYLDGDPIEARPTTIFYRWKLKAAKHRMAVAVGSVALVLLAAVGVWGGFTAWSSARRARLAQSFGQQVERIEALARYSHTIPLHDVRPDRARIRERMDRIEQQMAAVGRIGLGPGHYALGRGYMSTESWNGAREHLETAWDEGYREPEVALALGRVMGVLYHEALQETAQIGSQQLREAHREEIEKAYLEPAIRHLREGSGAEMESPEFVAGLLAYYEKRYDDALASAREAFTKTPWMYEARSLEGDVHEAVAIEKWNRGEYDAALDDYRLAREAYVEALEVGESDPGVHTGLCSLFLSMMHMEMQGSAGDVTTHFENGTSACDRALLAAPGDLETLLTVAALHNRMGEYHQAKNEDPTEYLEHAIEVARQALETQPDARAHGSIGSALRLIGVFERDRGNDPRDYFEQAARAHQEAIALNPDDRGYNDLGIVYKNLAGYEMGRGEDPRASLRKSIDAYRESLVRNPNQVAALTNLGSSHYDVARWEMSHGEDPSGSLDEAVQAFRSAEKINPNQVAVLYNLGRAQSDHAYHMMGRGEDPRALVNEAVDAFQRAIEVNPESAYVPYFYSGMGSALDALAHYEWDIGQDPTVSLQKTLDAYLDAVSSNPKHVYSHLNLGIAHAFAARCELELGEDPRESVKRAIDGNRNALELKSDLYQAYDNMADVHAIRAEYGLDHEIDPGTTLRAGRAVVAQSQQINPNSAYSHMALGRLRTLEGRWRMARHVDPGKSFEEALAPIEKAIGLDPDSAGAYVAVAALYRWRAEWRMEKDEQAGPEIELGLEMVEKSLSINPRSAGAMGLRGILLALEAESEPSPARREEILRQAEASLSEAIAVNANLSGSFGPHLESTKKLLRETDGNPG